MDEVDPPDGSPPVVESPTFEGREVPRESSGRVSRNADIPEGETIGTPEQIAVYTLKLEEMKSRWTVLSRSEKKLYRQLNVGRARLMRRRDRQTRDKLKLRLVKAQSAEKIARRTVEEAAKAVEGTAQILKGAITDFGKAATEHLLPSLISDVCGSDPEHRREAQRMLRDITIALIELEKSAQKKVNEADKRNGPVATQWPDEGTKT